MSRSITPTPDKSTSGIGGEVNPETNPTQQTDYARAREPESLSKSPRCQARTRAGKPCRSPAVRGKRVCRMHGARGGGPKGERNGAYKHGAFTVEAINLRREVAALLKSIRDGASV